MNVCHLFNNLLYDNKENVAPQQGAPDRVGLCCSVHVSVPQGGAASTIQDVNERAQSSLK